SDRPRHEPVVVRVRGQRGRRRRRRPRRTAAGLPRVQRDERRAARAVTARVLRRVCGRARPGLPNDSDSPGVCRSRDRPLHRSPAGAGGGVLRLGREPLHRRSDPRRARLAAADARPRGHRTHGRLVRRKRKARALVPGIVSVLSGSWLRPALFLGGGLGGRFGGRGHLLRRIGHHLVGRVGHHHMRRIGHHHLGRVGRRLRRLLLGLLTRAHRHQGEDHCETLHAGSSREKSSGAGFGRGKPSGGPPGVKTAARCRVYQADMTDRRSFVAWLGTLPLGGRDRPLRSPPIVIEATPTALYQQPDGRNNLVRVAVTGLEAPAARARVTDRRGTLVGTAECALQVISFVENRTPRAGEALARALRDGRVGFSAVFAQLLTGLLDHETFARVFWPAGLYAREHGLGYRAAQLADVPGQVLTFPTLLAASGVRYLASGVNPERAAPLLSPADAARAQLGGGGGAGDWTTYPQLYWWEGPDGSRVLHWRSDQYADGSRFGFDVDAAEMGR